MTDSMIFRGTFRLSLVLALLTFLWTLLTTTEPNYEAAKRNFYYQVDGRKAFECAEQFQAKGGELVFNSTGNTDLAQIGCFRRQYIASREELRKGSSQFEANPQPPEGSGFDWPISLIYAALAFLAVNLLGLMAVALRTVALWIGRGFGF